VKSRAEAIPVLLGIDIGTTSVKGIVIRVEDGGTLIRASQTYQTMRPQTGWVEQDPRDWTSAVASLWTFMNHELKEYYLVGVGICSQVNTHVLVDLAGAPVTPAIVWKDLRAADEAKVLQRALAHLTQNSMLESAPLNIDATSALARLAWWQQNDPDMVNRAHRLLLPKDFVVSALTGADVSDPLSAIGLVDTNGIYSKETLGLLDRSAELLPRLAPFDSVAGYTTGALGLPKGVPVAVGTMDAWGNVYGSGLRDRSRAMQVAGTSEIVGVLSDQAHPTEGIVSFPPVNKKILHAGPTQAGGDAISWFSELVGRTIEDVFIAASSSTRSDSRVVFLPHLDGERAPVWNPDAQGVWLGLNRTTGFEELALSVLEGVAYSARHVLERCEVAAGGRVDAIRLSGGAAKSDLWNQIKANVHGRPVEVLSELDTGARGAALIVGRAIELTDDLEKWSSDLAHVRITMEPSASDAARHDQGYEIYRNAYQALEPVFAANQGAPHV